MAVKEIVKTPQLDAWMASFYISTHTHQLGRGYGGGGVAAGFRAKLSDSPTRPVVLKTVVSMVRSLVVSLL